jgi:uncharacterized protein (UPF0264 family)
MRLLISVSNAGEASAALAGGADIVDAKDPLSGALGRVSLEVLRDIVAVVAGARLVTAALGDAADEQETERAAHAFTAAGAALVKVGFSGETRIDRMHQLTAAAVRGCRSGSEATGAVVAVLYADVHRVGGATAGAFVETAARAGAAGVLLDTADKTGPGLRGLVGPSPLASWIGDAHDAGLLVALAGKLSADDFALLHDCGADIAGVRGAACDDGRTGRISVRKVAALRALCASGRPVAESGEPWSLNALTKR